MNNGRESRLNGRLILNNSTLLSVISVNGPVTGVTVLGSELFVVRAGDLSEVYVYNTNNFTLTRNISITGSTKLRAILASPRYNCLYISDPGLGVIYRYNLSNKVITKWFVGDACYGLSLTSTDNVLVTLRDSKQIKEFAQDGRLVRQISLDSSIVDPYHSVQLSSDRFVVCHGLYDSVHRVCMLNHNSIIKCEGGRQGSGFEHLYEPRNLAVNKLEHVLVTDRLNNRVVWLNPSLTFLSYIDIPGYQLFRPWALHLDELTHRLYIGEWTYSGRVFVLNISF